MKRNENIRNKGNIGRTMKRIEQKCRNEQHEQKNEKEWNHEKWKNLKRKLERK